MFEKRISKVAIGCLAAVSLGACIALTIVFMPAKSEWANDYREYANTLANDDPLRRTLDSMLADGKLSIWEISGILCGEARGCRLDNFTEILISPEAADMFAQTVLVNLKHRNISGG